MRINGVMPAALAGSGDPTPMEQTMGGWVKRVPGTGAATAAQAAEKQFTREELAQAVDQLNKTMQAYATELRFEIHEPSGEVMVRVMNRETDTVIREIPPREVLDMVAYFKKMLGIIIDKMI